MSEFFNRSAPDPSDSSLSPAPSALRRVGDYLLVAQLGDDAAGSVYRALHTSDGRFVRLRVLQSPELCPRSTAALASRQIQFREALGSEEVARRCEIHIADGIPYLVRPEINGWTLDHILARARAGGWGMPIEFALLIMERAAAQIAQTSSSTQPAEPCAHGALWPGFVSISPDSAVRVEGFGLAEILLPALTKPRMWRDIAPYIAPEVRESGRPAEIGDVYSIGVLLAELLTGQRASADTAPPRWRADDDFSQEVSLLLRFALGHPAERFSSVAELHACLKELIAACPFETSPADLALFLYDRLNPESRILRASFDGSSTNPLASERQPAPLLPGSRGAAPHPSVIGNREPAPRGFGESRTFASLSGMRRIRRIAAVAAAIVSLIVVDLPIRRASAPLGSGSVAGPAPWPTSSTPMPLAAALSPAIELASSRDRIPRLTMDPPSPARSRARRIASPRAPAGRHSEARVAAETLRLKAALERIEAERLDALEHAGDAFRHGRSEEQEAQRLLSGRDYAGAGEAYARALELFSQAESLSREERVRQIQIAGDTGVR